MTQLTEGKKHAPFEARIASELKGLFVGRGKRGRN